MAPRKAKKPAAKKPPAKKVTAKKVAAKKVPPKKVAPVKAAPKKAAPKKVAARKKVPPAEKRKGGKPTIYTPEIIVRICEQLSVGIPMAVICRQPGMPGVTTVWEWQRARKDVSESIARARYDGYDYIAAECLEIANSPIEGEEREYGLDGILMKRKVGDMLGHRRLQIDTRLKLLAKWSPKKYGDRIGVDHDTVGNLTELLKARRKKADKDSEEDDTD